MEDGHGWEPWSAYRPFAQAGMLRWSSRGIDSGDLEGPEPVLSQGYGAIPEPGLPNDLELCPCLSQFIPIT